MFRPGQGAGPPRLAGREAELGRLQVFLDGLLEREAPSSDVVLFGPRGNGKTVLLARFEEECRAAVDVIALTPADINTETALAIRLLHRGPATIRDADNLALSRGRADVRLLSGEWSRMDRADREAYLTTFLTDLLVERCGERPLVVTLDEAHTLDVEVGKRLLNLSQSVRKDSAPFLLVLAGTPNLEHCLGRMSATFWDRSEVLGIGRLSEPATREALVEPLAEHGIAFEPAALSAVVAESQQYPYFIQVWGETLCRALCARRVTRIDGPVVDQGRPDYLGKQAFYYRRRYKELDEQALLPAARVVAGMFETAPTRSEADLKSGLVERLDLSEAAARDAVRTLAHLGLVWEPPGNLTPDVEPGIPSLMTWVLNRA